MRVATHHVVKSISQRALLRHWREIANGRHLPAFDRFAPPARAHDPRQLMFWGVEGNGETRRFKTLHQGTYLIESFGIDPPPPQLLQTVVPPPLQQMTLEGLNACADQRGPFYMVISTTDDLGNTVDCERLLLPFGDASGEVRQIVASLQLISVDGRFTRETVLARFTAAAKVTFAARLASEQPAAASTP
jgi:hypothetical protein